MTPRPLALVTGGLHRIGAAIAARLGGAGYDLALHCRSDAVADPALVVALTAAGARWHIVRADLTEAGAADRLFDGACDAAGRVPTLLVNNASLFTDRDMAALDEGELTRSLAVHLVAPVLLAQRLWHGVLAAGSAGAVINILDQRVRQPVPDQIAYSLGKQGLSEATRTLALAMTPQVRVNAVAPGLTLPTDAYEPGRMERMAGLMPLGALPTPDSIADAVAYLAAARHVTGQTIFVDGGANLRGFERDFAHL